MYIDVVHLDADEDNNIKNIITAPKNNLLFLI